MQTSTGCLSKNQQVFPLSDETLGYSVQQYVLRQDVFESQALSFSDATTQWVPNLYNFSYEKDSCNIEMSKVITHWTFTCPFAWTIVTKLKL